MIEDVSSVFVYLVKHKNLYLSTNIANGSVFVEAVDKSLSKGFKNFEISSLFAREGRK